MPKPGPVITTARGNPITRNPARVNFAAEQLRTSTYSVARKAITERWGVSETTAERDLRAAKQLIALELDAIEVRATETRRNERIADKAETLAEKAAAVNDWAAAATLQRAAIAASREVSRLTGAYAPKQVEVTHTGTVEIALKLDAILDVLDEAGRAALHVVLAQIEDAKASGRLALPAPEEEVEDAEIVGEPAEPGDGEAN